MWHFDYVAEEADVKVEKCVFSTTECDFKTGASHSNTHEHVAGPEVNFMSLPLAETPPKDNPETFLACASS